MIYELQTHMNQQNHSFVWDKLHCKHTSYSPLKISIYRINTTKTSFVASKFECH